MDILNQMVQLMDRKDVKNFKIYISRAWEGEDRKDVQLFDYIRKSGEEYEDEKAYKKLYAVADDKNAFYRLKNRLIEDINKSIFLKEYKDNDTMLSFYTVALGFYYYSKNQFRLAYYHFKKAEKRAKEIENYGLLDIIYSRLINISQEIATENPEYYLAKRKENTKKLNTMSELENILQAIEYRLKKSQGLSSQAEVLDLLNITIDNYTQDEELKHSSRLQFGIYKIVRSQLWQNNDFAALEDYLIKTYQDFQEKKFFNRGSHDYNLEIMSWIAITEFKNKKYKQSLEHGELLKQEMERYDRMLYDRYEFFYYQTLFLNYSAINPNKALEFLQELTKNDKLTKSTYTGIFIFANLAILHHQKKEYTKALKQLTRLYGIEGFKGTDQRLQLKIILGELIIRYEMKDMEVLDYRFRQVQKEFEELLLAEPDLWERDFLEVFEIMLNNENFRRSTTYKEKVGGLLEKLKPLAGTEEIQFNYDGWLKEKAGLS